MGMVLLEQLWACGWSKPGPASAHPGDSWGFGVQRLKSLNPPKGHSWSFQGQELNGALCISKEQRCPLQSTKQKNNPGQQHNGIFKKKSAMAISRGRGRAAPGGSRRNERVGSWAWREEQWGMNNSVPWEIWCGDATTWQSLGRGLGSWTNSLFPCAAWNEDFAPGIMTMRRSSGRNCPHPAPLVLQDGRSHHQRCSQPGEMQLLLLYTRLDLVTSMSRRVALQAIQPCLSPGGPKLELPWTRHAKYT